jgi:hypothetical protein
MDLMHERVAGLDMRKETITACERIRAGGKVTRECRTFDTTTAAGVDALLSWLWLRRSHDRHRRDQPVEVHGSKKALRVGPAQANPGASGRVISRHDAGERIAPRAMASA